LFTQALALPAAERAAFLREACGADAELLRRVETLLRVHEAGGDFLEVAPRAAGAWRADQSTREEASGERIGRYRLLEKIGEGGCGTVWMAEQEEPVKRQVALKVIKLGMDTQEVIARFEAERQALALMDHPNIARVLDAGATEAGRPFFVMELVRGTKITEFCDQNRLGTAARLELFMRVCQAVEHAHQKGIIHRDLKPSNILVTLQDGRPVPKVIDFGIAKATQGRLADQTVFTACEQFIGTPAYMSPEQAEWSSLDVDTRSDIYSLGVLLYELLTGCPPFDPQELVRAGVNEMRRRIREVEPPKPSTRLRMLAAGALTTTAARRATESLRLIHGIRGDLDWIVMRCLEKNRARRYETASNLAGDIQRHLGHEPVVARPPGRFYRFGKFIRRNRLAFGAATVAAAALVIGLGGVTWAFLHEKAAHARAVAAEQTAREEGAKSEQVVRFFRTMLESVEPAVAAGRDPKLMRDILDKTAQRIGRDLPNPPAVEAELRTTLGEVYHAIGEYEKAETMFREALKLQRQGLGGDHPDIARSLHQLAVTRQARGDLTGAEGLEREVLAMRRQLLGNEHLETAGALSWLAVCKTARGDLVSAESLQREALAIQRQLVGDGNVDTAATLEALAGTRLARGYPAEAEAMARAVLATRRQLLGNDHRDVTATLTFLATTRAAQGDWAGAEAQEHEVLAMRRKQLGNTHPDVASAMGELATTLQRRGDLAGAEEMLREALAMRRKLFGETHVEVADSLQRLSSLRQARGDLAGAETLAREVQAMRRQLLGPEHPEVALSLYWLATIKQARGDRAAAEVLLREALAMQSKLFGEEHGDVARSLQRLAELLQYRGASAEAEMTIRQALGIQRRLLGDESPAVAGSLDRLAEILQVRGDLAGAERALGDALAMRRKLPDGDHGEIAANLRALDQIRKARNASADRDSALGAPPAVERPPADSTGLPSGFTSVRGGDHPGGVVAPADTKKAGDPFSGEISHARMKPPAMPTTRTPRAKFKYSLPELRRMLASTMMTFATVPLPGLALLASVFATPAEAQTCAVTTFAGQSGWGSDDGTGSAARFYTPGGVTVDVFGNVLVADAANHTIRKVTAAGVVSTVAGLAGSAGSTDGTGSTARFNYPRGLVVDSAGNVYVPELGNHTVRKITSAGVVSTIAGLAGNAGSADGAGSVARFNSPIAAALDSAGNVYVADSGNHTIRKITAAGVVSTIAGLAGNAGSTDGIGSLARFNNPDGIAVDGSGNIYVAESANHTIRKITPDGLVSTLAGVAGSSGNANGTGGAARFNGPEGLALDSVGNLYVSDSNNHTIRRITTAGVVSTVAGLAGRYGSADGAGSVAQFRNPTSVALDAAGNVYVADFNNFAVRKITPAGVVSTLAGLSTCGSTDGTGPAARFKSPYYLTVDDAGIVYVTDTDNFTVRKITRDGVVSTLAGLAGSNGSADGPGNVARFAQTEGIALDGAGNVYVADYGFSTIRKITSDGTVSTLAGLAGNGGTADGLGSAARFQNPRGVALDNAGNLYIADSGNNTIRKVTPGGFVSTFAGAAANGAGSADGVGSAAQFNGPKGVAVDSAGNVYVADSGNHTIRQITPGGVVSTLAGSAGSPGNVDGTGNGARFNGPWGLAVDAAGNVFVADYNNAEIRKISPNRVVTTIAGSSSGSTDGLGTAARFYLPTGVVVDKQGTLYVSELLNGTIRRIVPTGNVNPTSCLSALSVRADIVAGQKLIVGFAMTGGAKQVLIRAIGPSLQPYMPAGSILAGDPYLELYDGQSRLIAVNDNWGGAPALAAAATSVSAFPLPNSSLDAVLMPTIDGTCTAQFSTTTTGTGLMEAYDVAGGMSPRLTGVSARYRVSDGALIAGFAVGGTGLKTLLVRGVGPGLAQWLGAGALADPKLEVYNAANQLIAANDNWPASLGSAFTLVQDFSLVAGSKDAAVLITVAAPGVYTAVIKSADGGSGEALVEVYEVP
jgi:tetratricopeptide (TPR) repeat protein/sugar lactone lactonase YvrE